MQLSAAIIVLAASLPHAKVGYPICSFHAENQVLDEGNLHVENKHTWDTWKTCNILWLCNLHTQSILTHTPMYAFKQG